jgi:predicted TIM-barrel fold metal-dependent hydrolase
MNELRIDVHVHIVALNEKEHGCYLSPRMRRHPIFRLWALRYNFIELTDAEFDRKYIETLINDVQDAEGIDKVIILAMDAIYDTKGKQDRRRTHSYVSNDYILRLVSEHECLLPGVSVHPARPDALDELDHCAAEGAVLVKWLPNSQCIDPANPDYDNFYSKLRDLKLPLLTHTGYEHMTPAPYQQYGDPRRLQRALDAGVTVIAGHSGTSGFARPVEYFDHFLLLIEKYPNLYGDLAAFTSISRAHYLMRFLREPELMSRMVQGSDYPVPPTPWLFVRQLGLKQCFRLQREKNIFTRDYLTKRALGVPEEIFTRAAYIIDASRRHNGER